MTCNQKLRKLKYKDSFQNVVENNKTENCKLSKALFSLRGINAGK